uniref:Uncharacterized protein n=1 Tax=Fopius arisanus TaxID=64838 RepID=A0A0C9PI27_9HYME
MDYAGRIGAKTRASEESRAEEMKRELSALNLYEGGMTMKEMYHMLTAVKDSMKNPGDMSRENSMATEMISTPPAEPPSQKPARSSRDSSSPELTSAYFSTRVRPTTKKPEEEDLDDSPECTRMSPTIGALHILSPSPPRLGTLSTAPAAVPPLQSTTNIPKKNPEYSEAAAVENRDLEDRSSGLQNCGRSLEESPEKPKLKASRGLSRGE